MQYLTVKDFTAILAGLLAVASILLLACPGVLRKCNKGSKQWFSMRKFMRPFDLFRDIDENILKMSRPLGVIALILTIVFIYLTVKM